MAEGCNHKFEVGGTCVRCGDTFTVVQVTELQGIVEQYEAIATQATALAQETTDRFEKAVRRANAADAELRALRIANAAGLSDPHWLIKDFNVLYAVTRDLLLAVGRGNETETAHALNFVAAQLTRLKPAFTETEEVKRIVRERRG